jgi:RecB family exonuclease
MAPTERGKVIDRALQLIWEQLQNSEGLKRPDRAAIVEAAADAAMASQLPPSNDAWTTRFRALERQRTVAVLTEWLDLESTRKPFHVLGHQLPVELTLGGLALRGCLDRLDEIDDSQLVIDYKTGDSYGVNAWQVPRPRMPQLPFYALAMQQQKFNLAGVSFAIVRRGGPAFRAYLREKDLLPSAAPNKFVFEELAFDEYTPRWAEELERIAASFAQGAAAVDPKIPPGRSGSSCEHCHLASLCRIGELADGDSDSGPGGDGHE